MKVKVEPDAEAKFVRKSLKSSIACLKGFDSLPNSLGILGKEEKKDMEALKRVLDFYGG